MPVDVVLAASGLEDEFLDRTRVVGLGGTSILASFGVQDG